MNRKKQKVYIIIQYPTHPDHLEEARIVGVYGTKEGALLRKKRLQEIDNNSTYHMIKKSVEGTIASTVFNTSTYSILDFVEIIRGKD